MTKTIIQMLHKIGPTNRSELIDLIPGVNLALLNKLEHSGHIKKHPDDKDAVLVTNAGRRSIGISIQRLASSKCKPGEGYYQGLELRAFDGRPGCNQALELPSRHMNTLTYRDGRETPV